MDFKGNGAARAPKWTKRPGIHPGCHITALMPTIRWHPSDDHAHQTNSLIIQKHIACPGSSQSHLELHQEDVPVSPYRSRFGTKPSPQIPWFQAEIDLLYTSTSGLYSIMSGRTWPRLMQRFMQVSGENRENRPRQEVPRSMEANNKAAFCLHTASPKNYNPTTY
jgi:hypothetical protein